MLTGFTSFSVATIALLTSISGLVRESVYPLLSSTFDLQAAVRNVIVALWLNALRLNKWLSLNGQFTELVALIRNDFRCIESFPKIGKLVLTSLWMQENVESAATSALKINSWRIMQAEAQLEENPVDKVDILSGLTVLGLSNDLGKSP